MELSQAQKQTFYRQGFLHVPGVVPRIMVEAAMQSINRSLGSEGIPPDRLPFLHAQSFCPSLQKKPVITDLFTRTPALALAESMIGEGRIRPVGGAQIALRFPNAEDPPRPPRPHLDGTYSPTNGVPEGTIGSFTALACVLLSPVTHTYAGNFTVWPGTHLQHEAYFRIHTPQALLKGPPPIDLPEPVQLLGQPGDLVLAHYLLAHSAASNATSNIRYAIFFRLSHDQHSEHKWDTMSDAWLEWEGMREIAAAERNEMREG